MSASAVSGVRWATAQILLQKKSWGKYPFGYLITYNLLYNILYYNNQRG